MGIGVDSSEPTRGGPGWLCEAVGRPKMIMPAPGEGRACEAATRTLGQRQSSHLPSVFLIAGVEKQLPDQTQAGAPASYTLSLTEPGA